MILSERFSSSGLAGAYADELAIEGVIAIVAFRPRRHLDPQPFVVERLQPPAESSAPGAETMSGPTADRRG